MQNLVEEIAKGDELRWEVESLVAGPVIDQLNEDKWRTLERSNLRLVQVDCFKRSQIEPGNNRRWTVSVIHRAVLVIHLY